MLTVALYARVSSERQAQANTIESQIESLKKRISADGYTLLEEFQFIDNGYSGSNLSRPGLEKLRDKVAGDEIERIYIHSPDRLSRKYAYQMVLLEEFQKAGAEVIFLNHEVNNNPESHLLLQMQGMIAEYERAKIMERNRRGKIHGAKKGSINVLSGAPYGYRYIDKHSGGGQAFFEIHEEEAEIVRKIFSWIGRDRLSMCEVCRRLTKSHQVTRKGKAWWNRSVIWRMLKNPAYKGQAAFGKTKKDKKISRLRPYRRSKEHSKWNFSTFIVEESNWIYIPVPAIIDEFLFNAVQEQLKENRSRARVGNRGANYLLQGLLVCKCCDYAYYGKPIRKKMREKMINYSYYRCLGSESHRFSGTRICHNKTIRTDVLDTAVWEEVKLLLKNPDRILVEYHRRLDELNKSPVNQMEDSLERQENKLKRGISRLIDSYAQEHINKEEFEPRIKSMKKRLSIIDEQRKNIMDQTKLKNELTLMVTNLERFSSNIETKLENLDWHSKRDIIKTLIKRIEINNEDVNVVFRVNELPTTGEIGTVSENDKKSLQHCCMSQGK